MVASSEQQSAPVMVNKPATVQASSNQPGAPIRRADSAEVMKMPEPIIEPTTIMVASSGPRARTNRWLPVGLVIVKISARGPGRLPLPNARAMREQIAPRPRCRRAHKSSPPVDRHLLRRPTALFPRATCERLARPPLPYRATGHRREIVEGAFDPRDSCDRQKLHRRYAIHGI